MRISELPDISLVSGAARKNAALFCALLELLATTYGRHVRRIHLVVDNYGIHSARATRRALGALQNRIVLHFLPPYCPDANRIERVWQDFHANVTRNHRCKTMKALLGNARAYLGPTSGAASRAPLRFSVAQHDVVRESRAVI